MVKRLLTESPPDISIIIPTLNEQEHIKFLLSSLEKQHPINFETFIIDGGSEDETSQVGQKYNAQVLTFPGYGEFISRNIGAKRAKLAITRKCMHLYVIFLPKLRSIIFASPVNYESFKIYWMLFFKRR